MRSDQNQNRTTIIPHPRDYHGGFVAHIDPKSTAEFLGNNVNELELLERLGALPDNKILGNALIKTFGSRVLDIIYAQRPDQQKEHDSLLCASYADEMELRCTWRMTEIFVQLKSLEKNLEKNLADSNTQTIPELDLVAITYLPNIQPLPHDLEILNTLLKSFDTEILGKINNKIPEFNNAKTKLAKQQILKSLYQEIIEQFELQQAAIFVRQRQAQTQMAIANGTNTNTTQAAYKLVREHVFSQTPPSAEQLYLQENTENSQKTIQLDTALLASVKPERLLKALSIVQVWNTKDQEQSINDIKDKFKKLESHIKTTHIDLKNQIDRARKELSTGFEWVLARLNLYRDRAVMRAVSNTSAGNVGLNVQIKNLLNPKQTTTNATQTETNPEYLLERPAMVYHSHDLVSAMSGFNNMFLGYFSDLATRHPIVFSSSFLYPQALTLSHVLAANHIAPMLMNSIFNHLIPTTTLQQPVHLAINQWLEMTHSTEFVKQLILGGIGLPKLSYVIEDAVLDYLNGLDEGTIANLARELSKGEINTDTTADKKIKLAKTITKDLVLISLAIALGIGAQKIPSSILGADLLKSFMNIMNPSQEAMIGSMIQHPSFSSLLNLLIVSKTAVGFLAKIYAIMYFSNDTHHHEKLDALSYYMQLYANTKKITAANSNQSENDGPKSSNQDQEQEQEQKHKIMLEQLFKEHPELEFCFDSDFIGFLKTTHEIKINHASTIDKSTKFIWLLIRKVVGTIWSYLVGAISLVILPVFYLAKNLFSKQLENNKLLIALTAYLEKRCLKLVKNFILLPIVYAFWPVKILTIAFFRSLSMLIIGLLALIAEILITAFNVLKLVLSGQFKNSAKYLGLKLMSATIQVFKPIIRLLEELIPRLIIKPLIVIGYLIAVLALALSTPFIVSYFLAKQEKISNIFEKSKGFFSEINRCLDSCLLFVNDNKNFFSHAMNDAKIIHVNKSELIKQEWGRTPVNRSIAWLTCGALTIKQAVGKPFFLLNLYVMGSLNDNLQRAHMDELKHPVIPEIKKFVGSLFNRKQDDVGTSAPASTLV